MSQSAIRAALEAPLATWAAAQNPPLPVAWENVALDAQGRHIRASLLPAQTLSFDLLGKHRRFQGIFQLTLVMPTNAGMRDTEALVAGIGALYPNAARFTSGGISVLIAKPASAAPPLVDDGQLAVPVSIRYQADTTV